MAAAGKCCKRGLLSFRTISHHNKQLLNQNTHHISLLRSYVAAGPLPKGPTFGLFFDIDGVIVRGRKVLPHAREAFKLLTDKNGHFWVPTIFVTNAGNTLRQQKADQLSEWLNVKVSPSQVVMSHSPLQMFRQFLDKHVLVTGQGPTTEIAKQLGFTRITTIETLRKRFPKLDVMDHKRTISAPCAFENFFPKIEAVIMFGEPVRWEMNLQLIMDILLTNGQPSAPLDEIPYPHIPVLACNVDLVWMAEAPMPRFGHGAFLHCVESLYKKISGYELKYTALVGKPSEVTYHHSENVLQNQARDLGLSAIQRMYCVGDNPDIDIYGANLFNHYLQKKAAKRAARRQKLAVQGADLTVTTATGEEEDDDVDDVSDDKPLLGAQSCKSILVATGVYSRANTEATSRLNLDYMHRDFIMEPELRKPTIEVSDVLEAIQKVFDSEGITT